MFVYPPSQLIDLLNQQSNGSLRPFAVQGTPCGVLWVSREGRGTLVVAQTLEVCFGSPVPSLFVDLHNLVDVVLVFVVWCVVCKVTS